MLHQKARREHTEADNTWISVGTSAPLLARDRLYGLSTLPGAVSIMPMDAGILLWVTGVDSLFLGPSDYTRTSGRVTIPSASRYDGSGSSRDLSSPNR